MLAFIVCVTTTWIADRTQQRGVMLVVLSLIGGIGYIILATCEGTAVRYFAVFLAAAGVFSCIANVLPWTINNQGSDSKRGAAIALLNIIGQAGPLLGTRGKWLFNIVLFDYSFPFPVGHVLGSRGANVLRRVPPSETIFFFFFFLTFTPCS